MKTTDTEAYEPGCYVDDHWGIYAAERLAQQFPDHVTDSEHRILRAYSRGFAATYDTVSDILDAMESRINNALPAGLIAHWFDGAFFISPYCDEDPDCDDETCYCHTYY